ncbi:MAG: PBP1A family penicillin-binding protein [Deltaproteobacteria bacterium]|nr:PBP1A family penicillin-binding protein [Deltaproteobacteria bacterium]
MSKAPPPPPDWMAAPAEASKPEPKPAAAAPEPAAAPLPVPELVEEDEALAEAEADAEVDEEQVGDGLILETPRKKKTWKQKLAFYVLLPVVLLGLAGLGGVLGIFWYYGQDPAIPTFSGLADYRPPMVTDVFSGDDQLVGEFYQERRRVVPYRRIPKRQVQAFLAVEDSRFFAHIGIDPMGMAKAVIEKLLHGGKLRGGSTLTQQTAKAILVSEWGFEAASARTIRRKVIEMILAMRLESIFTKEEILGIYLNHVYLGHHSYGVQSASENYFRKNVEDLTLGEMALLAGLPQAPSRYSPYVNPKRAKERRAHVLARMAAEGMITEAERDEAVAEEVVAYPIEDVFRETTPFYTEHVRRYIVDRYSNERLLRDGLKVYTSVDLEKQRYAQDSMIQGLSEVDKRQGYTGPLAEIPRKDWGRFAETYDEKVLQGKSLEYGENYVGLVTKVTSDEVTVKVGRHEGLLPLAGMRWAHKASAELYYPSALISDARKALDPGDAILVKRVKRTGYPWDEDASYRTRIPKDADLLFTLEQEPELQGALISMDPDSSYVVAMIGGLDFELSEYNRAFQACRQPGSAFKPIVYSAALHQLEWTPSTIIIDAPIVEDDPDNQLRWKPQNYGMDFKGEVTLRNALVHSMNVPAIKTLDAVGVKNAIAWAHQLGISTKINEDLSIALGSSCVTLWELTNVYALFNRYGKRMTPTFVRRVVDRDGNLLEDRTVYFDPYASLTDRIAAGHARLYEQPEQVIPPPIAYLTTYLMNQVVKHGTAVAARALGQPAAGKTGTTNDSFDAWFMGFTHNLVTGVWIGYDRYDHPMGRYENGGRAALPIWLSYMKRALAGREEPDFVPVPASLVGDIVLRDVDLETGKLADPSGVRPKIEMAYLRGSEPTEVQGELTTEDGGFQEAMAGGSDL